MQLDHQKYMKLAIDKTTTGINLGQTPFGACIVNSKTGKVISLEHNVVWKSTDITMHAEMHAIRSACKKLKTIDLKGCVIYSTTEPCPMCFAAIHWANIDAIYFGASIADAKKAGFNELTISNSEMKKKGKSKVKIFSGVMKKECAALFDAWKKAGKNKVY